MSNPLPELLFRFRSLVPASKPYVESSIRNSEIYFSPPGDLNDPFDCQLAVDVTGTDKEWLEHVRSSLVLENDRRKKKLSFMERHREAKKYVDQGNHRKLDGKDFAKMTSTFGVACFSGFMNSQLMWSHYADNHRGICLIYKPELDFSGLLRRAYEVEYKKEYPQVRLVDFNKLKEVAVNRLLLTKSKDWAYEAEYRLLRAFGAKETVRHSPQALVGVVLGARISQENLKDVTSWLATHPDKPFIHQANLNHGEYGVNITPYKSN